MPQVRPMNKISEVIVVEGRYDKNTLSQVVDAVIIETSGFGVFNNKEKQQLLRTLAEKCGMPYQYADGVLPLFGLLAFD